MALTAEKTNSCDLRRLRCTVLGGEAPIVAVVVGDEGSTLRAGKWLFDHGYYVQSVIFPAVGFNQGVFRVVAGESGWIVTPPANLPAVANVRVVRGDAARRPLPLADFELRVRTLAGSSR